MKERDMIEFSGKVFIRRNLLSSTEVVGTFTLMKLEGVETFEATLEYC